MAKFKIYIYFILAGLVVVGGMVFTIYFGLEPKPVQKIRLSEFDRLEDVSKSLHMRLWQELRDAQIVFLGVEPGVRAHLQLWDHFVKNPYEGDLQFDEMYIEPGLKYADELKGYTSLDIKQEHETLVKSFAANKDSKRRVLFILPHIYAAQVIKDNPVNRLVKESGVRVYSMTLAILPKSESDFALSSLPCAAEGADYTGQSPLGCLIRHKYKTLKKSKLESNKILALTDQIGLDDYLVLMSQ